MDSQHNVPPQVHPVHALVVRIVEERVDDDRYMKTVDNFNNKLISAFVTAGSTRPISEQRTNPRYQVDVTPRDAER